MDGGQLKGIKAPNSSIWMIPNFKLMLLDSAAFFIMLFSFYSSVNVYSKLLKVNGHENLGF